ncbi:MAG: DUF2157 domain-containing protein [Methylococcaceae bacterium]|nr:DUF2157 domain-containing protein [Methylococcaceae bacterium]
MRLARKLKEWQGQNLIDSVTVNKINEYEKQQAKPLVLWAFGGLGVFTVLLGIISVIASNWMQTPDWLKLATDLIVCLVIAIALYKVVVDENTQPSKPWLREMLVIFYYGFTLASMALIGQTYQLGGSLASLFLVWTIATLPVVLLGRGKFLAVFWIAGTVTTYILNIQVLDEFIRGFDHLSPLMEAIMISSYLLLPLFFIFTSRIPWLLKKRPILSSELSKYSWIAILLIGWCSQFLWYESIDSPFHKVILYSITICFIAISVMSYFIPSIYSDEPRDSHLAMRVILIAVFMLCVTALWHHTRLELVGALTNILYMLVLAWAALKIKSIRLFNVVTALICLRVLFVYFEVFGSMFETGIGLVIGGTLTLLIVWWWFKKSDSFAQRFGLSRSDIK